MTGFEPRGRHVLLARGSLAVSGPRELLVSRSAGGAYERDGTLAGDTVPRLGSENVKLSRSPERLGEIETIETREDEVVWGGDLSPGRFQKAGFGRFLVESVGRMWPLLPGGELEGLPVVFTGGPAPPYAREWLEAFGARLVEPPEAGSVRFTGMYVPEAAWQVDAWIAPEIRDVHLHARRGMSVPQPEIRHEALWLSRAEGDGRPDGEEELESLLGDRAKVATPARLSLAEQVALLESSSSVAGVIGSAFHVLLLAARQPRALYLCPPWPRESVAAQHQVLDGEAVFARALEVASLDRESRRRGVDFPRGYRILVPEALRALGETDLSPPPTPRGEELAPRPAGGRWPGGTHVLLSRGSLTVAAARELFAGHSSPCAYEPDGSPADDTRRVVGESALRIPVRHVEIPRSEVAHVEEEMVWGGQIAPVYGHFLVESVARLWPLLPSAQLEGTPVVFTGRGEPYVREWLEAFGAEVIALPESGFAGFRRMFVPEPAWQMGAWIAPEVRDIHLHARAGMKLPSVPRTDVLWLSKSGLPDRSAHDELLFEWLLADNLTCVSPETMTLAEQVALLESSRAVAGVMGSAFHTLLLAARQPRALYLCPPWGKPPFTVQHWLLDGSASFVPTLEVAGYGPRKRRRGFAFPHGYRILVPEALRALNDTLLPSLLDDPRLACFAELGGPGRRGAAAAFGSLDGAVARVSLDGAVARVIEEPLSIDARTRLASLFAAAGLVRCAEEQERAVRELEAELNPAAARSG